MKIAFTFASTPIRHSDATEPGAYLRDGKGAWVQDMAEGVARLGHEVAVHMIYPWTGTTTNLTHTEPWQKAIAHYAIWKIHDELTHKAGLADKNQIMYLAEAQELKESQEKIWKGEADGLRRDGEMATLDTFGGI